MAQQKEEAAGSPLVKEWYCPQTGKRLTTAEEVAFALVAYGAVLFKKPVDSDPAKKEDSK